MALVGEHGEGELAGPGGVEERVGDADAGGVLRLDVERVDVGAPRHGGLERGGRDADAEGRADKDEDLGAVEPVADDVVLEERVRRVVLVKEQRERHHERAAHRAVRRDHAPVRVKLYRDVRKVLVR